MVQRNPSLDPRHSHGACSCLLYPWKPQHTEASLCIFSKVRHSDQITGFSWMHSMWMCQACNFGTILVSKLLMLWHKVEVKETDSHFTRFLRGLQWRKCLLPEEDAGGCCSVHSWKLASFQPYHPFLLHIRSLGCWGCAGEEAGEFPVHALWE